MTGFRDLPAELRNDIYEMALVRQYPIHLIKYDCCHTSAAVCMAFSGSGQCYEIVGNYVCRGITVSLLRANRQIHREAASVLYGANTFIASSLEEKDEFKKQVGGTSAPTLARQHHPLSRRKNGHAEERTEENAMDVKLRKCIFGEGYQLRRRI